MARILVIDHSLFLFLRLVSTRKKMLRVLVLACVVAFVAAQSSRLDDIWASYKLKYEKSFSRIEERFRRDVFERTVASIQRHNLAADLGLSTYRQGINRFSDMPNAEYRYTVNGFRGNSSVPRTAPLHVVDEAELPKRVDWRKKGYVTPVKDQGQCGSCWAFSAVASLEGQHFAKKGKLVSLSEQNFVDCSDAEGNMGCNGGLMDQAFEYVIDNKGLDTEKCYPYTAQDDPCTFKKKCIGTLEVAYKDVTSGSEKALEHAIAKIGPISVAIDASNPSFQSYSSGVYDEPSCSSTMLDHGVTAVGYDSDSGDDYYIVKNSWGTDWGMKGYIWMSRNKDNQCGIATMSSYPTL